MENGVKDRINKIMRQEQMNASQFANAIGVQKASISHIISGRNNPSLDLVTKVLETFPQYNSEWLILGKGKMAKAVEVTQLFDELNTEKPQTKEESEKSSNITTETTNKIEPTNSTINTANQFTSGATTPGQQNTNIDAGNINNQQQAPQNNNNMHAPIGTNQLINAMFSDKQIMSVVVFYTDRTFREFKPSQD